MAKNICIVGAGLAGGVLANQLSQHGYPVTLIERGDTPRPYEPEDELWDFDKPKAAFTRGVGLGGTSNFWHGGLTILDRIDVEGDSIFPGHSKLPLNYDELLGYYETAINMVRSTDRYSLLILFPSRKRTPMISLLIRKYFHIKVWFTRKRRFLREPCYRTLFAIQN